MRARRVVNHLPEFAGPLIGLAELGNLGADVREWATNKLRPQNTSVVSTLEYAEELVRGCQLEDEKLYQPWTAMLFAMGAVKRVTELPKLGRVSEKVRAGEAIKAIVPTVISTALRLEVPNFEAIRFKPDTLPEDIKVVERSAENRTEFAKKHAGDFKILKPIMGGYWNHEMTDIMAGRKPDLITNF